jgi:hypothetical protein
LGLCSHPIRARVPPKAAGPVNCGLGGPENRRLAGREQFFQDFVVLRRRAS